MSSPDNPGDRTAEAIIGGTAPDLAIPPNLCLFEGNLGPCTIVIFGASGDLASRKLLPALYNLFLSRAWPKPCCIVGVARTPLGRQEFQSKMQTAITSQENYDQERWSEFAAGLDYFTIDTKLYSNDNL